MEDRLYFLNRDEFRDWLTHNHDKSDGIWLVYSKVPSSQTLTYAEALDEALCFGWIDSLIKRIDDEKYMRKFTPRRKNSKWSENNKNAVARLMDAGLMTEWGIRVIEEAVENGQWEKSYHPAVTPCDIDKFSRIIEEYPAEYLIYSTLSPSHRKEFAMFYFDAKQEATRARRLERILALIKVKKRLL